MRYGVCLGGKYSMNRRVFLIGAVTIPTLVALAAASPSLAYSDPNGVFAALHDGLVQWGSRTGKTAGQLAAVETEVAAVARVAGGVSWMRLLGRLAGAASIGLVILEIGNYVKLSNDRITVNGVGHYSGSLNTVFDIITAVQASGPIEYGGYGYTVAYGGTSTSFPSLDSDPSWQIFWIDTSGHYPRQGEKQLFVAQTRVQLTGMNDAQRAALLATLPQLDTGEMTDDELRTALSTATGTLPASEQKTLLANALAEMAPGIEPDDFTAMPSTSPLDLAQPIPADVSTLPDTLTGAESSSSSSSTNSSSASSSSSDGLFSLPGVPSVPEPPQWFQAWADQLNPLMPKIPTHTGACPTLTYQLPSGALPNLTMHDVPITSHCALGAQMKPILRTFALAGSAISALMIILKA